MVEVVTLFMKEVPLFLSPSMVSVVKIKVTSPRKTQWQRFCKKRDSQRWMHERSCVQLLKIGADGRGRMGALWTTDHKEGRLKGFDGRLMIIWK